MCKYKKRKCKNDKCKINVSRHYKSVKGGANHRRRATTAVLHDFELSERLKHMDTQTIKGKTAEGIILKLSQSLAKVVEPQRFDADVINIARLEEGLKSANISRKIEDTRYSNAIKSGLSESDAFEQIKKSKVKKLDRLVEYSNQTMKYYEKDSTKILHTQILNSAGLKDYMPLCIARKIAGK